MFSNLLFGIPSDEATKLAVWNKGTVIPNYDPAVWRYDANGKVIKYSEHGNRYSQHGWEKDHFPIPKALGGSDHIGNLRPLNCFSNASHGGLLGALLNG